MNLALLAAGALLLAVPTVSAQPMSGPYTVGGSSPDFTTPFDATAALMARGMSAPVFLRIRPGTYSRNGGASPVFELTGNIAGVGPASRITIEPDATAGGTVDNVILKADLNASSTPRALTILRTDYTTIRNLTFVDADSMDTPVFAFILANNDNNNAFIDGLVVDGCVFLGTSHFPQFGSDIGIASDQRLADATFTHNRFHRVCRAITNVNSGASPGPIVVTDNEFLQGFSGFSGNPIGTAIELACTHVVVSRNVIDLAAGQGGLGGITVVFAASAVIERNVIENRVAIGGPFDNFTGITVRNPPPVVDSVVIANNVVAAPTAGGTSMCVSLETPRARVVYNTLLHGGGGGPGNVALRTVGSECTVLNNIIIAQPGFVVFDQGAAGESPGIASDYNVIFVTEASAPLVRRDGVEYTSLTGYQAGTGLDLHSASKSVLFSDLFHLDDCQANDPDLIGTPIAGIGIDFDGAARHPTQPFRGADESQRTGTVFGDGFRAGLPGPPLSLASGDFLDHDGDPDIVAPDYDHLQVLLFRNLRPARSFVQTGAMATTVQPTVIKLFDLDSDGQLDLIVGGDSPAVDVFWGNPAGGFGTRVTVATTGRVRSIEPMPPGEGPWPTVVITEDDGFLPSTGFLGFLNHLGGRQLCHDILFRQGPPPSFFYVPDTIATVMTDLVVGNLDGTNRSEVAVIGSGSPSRRFIVFRNLFRLGLNGFPCSESAYEAPREEFAFETGSYVGHNSSLVMGDFDGDGDPDFLSTTVSENEVQLIRNQGNLTFTPSTIPAPRSRGLAVLDVENDGDLDFVTTNRTLYDRGITLFLNDGDASFVENPSCFFPFASGFPNGVVPGDFDGDGMTDLALASSFDSLFVVYNLGTGPVGINDDPTGPAATAIALAQNYPNPFDQATTIAFQLPGASHVTITVYDVSGRAVATVLDEARAAGRNTVTWRGTNDRGAALSRGVYFYRLTARAASGATAWASSRKLLLLH